jgi:hypothetical protein
MEEELAATMAVVVRGDADPANVGGSCGRLAMPLAGTAMPLDQGRNSEAGLLRYRALKSLCHPYEIRFRHLSNLYAPACTLPVRIYPARQEINKQGMTSMTISIIHETRPFSYAPKSEVLRRRLAHELNRCAVPAAKIITFLGLGVFCILSSLAFLLSLGIAMPVLTEQVGTWLTSGRWNPVPLSMLLTRMGYSPHFDGTPIRAMVDWLLFSCETGLLIVVAASVFGCAVWLFETARSRLIAR